MLFKLHHYPSSGLLYPESPISIFMNVPS